ncbi:hypothetical protein IFR05_000714 [Cadophora sp. M221]|nr:hypothetical protein IFR05_000714 [Cadophora sp. M221]
MVRVHPEDAPCPCRELSQESLHLPGQAGPLSALARVLPVHEGEMARFDLHFLLEEVMEEV